jgi:hypothetical protein
MNDAHALSFSDSAVFGGIDVSKKTLDVCLLASKTKQGMIRGERMIRGRS